MSDNEQRLKELFKEGKHREAAEILLEQGDMKRAMEAYAAIWDYARAAEVALAASDRPAALDYLLRASNRAGAAGVLARLAQSPAEEAERAVEILLERGERDHAARLLESRGEHARAAELIKELGELRRAASLLERAGQFREAGRLYERLVSDDPNDTASALSLGTILRRFGKYELAARMLQVAAKDKRLRRTALRGLVVSLHGLGMQDAAASALDELLEEDGSAPRSVDALVASEEDTGGGGVVTEEGEQWVGGRYQVKRVLGGGAAGRVYLARDALYEREVALKVLAAGAGDGAGRDAFSRFAREAQIAAKLDHPNIVRVLDFDASAGVLVMEFLGGGTLADRMTSGPLSLSIVKHVFNGVLTALETAHIRGVVHRDVKPQNVLFARGGGVKLGDFGVAHLQDLGLTQTGAFIGTLTYMAPEQITGAKVNAGTDLYGLGVTIFHALCGRPPFTGADLVRQHLAEKPPRPSEVRPALGSRFDELMSRLLAKVPDERFTSAAEVRRAVASIDFTEPDDEQAPTIAAPEPIEDDEQDAIIAHEKAHPVVGGSGRRARHRLLDAPVLVMQLEDDDRLAHLETLGKVVSPFLQCVLDVDSETREATLELPSGESLALRLKAKRALAAPDAVDLFEVLSRALASLHAAGITHGELDAEKIVLGEHATSLLLPENRHDTGQESDTKALIDLFAIALGVEGDTSTLSELLSDGPLTEAIGPRRTAELVADAKQADTALDLAAFQAFLRAARTSLDDRRRAREHIHALAATARAAGADPAEGDIASFLERRRAELDI